MDLMEELLLFLFVLLSVLQMNGVEGVDCTNAMESLESIQNRIDVTIDIDLLCQDTTEIFGDIMAWQSCSDSAVQAQINVIWNDLIGSCQAAIKQADIDSEVHKEFECRREKCMITPDMEDEPEGEETDDGQVVFPIVPTSLLQALLDAFKGITSTSGASNSQAGSMNSGTTSDSTSLADGVLGRIGSLLSVNGSTLDNLDAKSVCQLLNKLDLERMLECIMNQKNSLECSHITGSSTFKGEEEAEKYRQVCKPACLDLPAGVDLTCTTEVKYNQHIEAIAVGAITYNRSNDDTKLKEACVNVQTKLFDCYSELLGCCDPAFSEIKLLYQTFSQFEYGGQSCLSVSEVILKEKAECTPSEDNDDTETDSTTTTTSSQDTTTTPSLSEVKEDPTGAGFRSSVSYSALGLLIILYLSLS